MARPASRPPLTVEKILSWADAYHARTGHWPAAGSGVIPQSPGDSWHGINTALVRGHRGLPGGSSLAALLRTHRGASRQTAKPLLSVEQILAWAQAHRVRTGKWPTAASGPVHDVPDENWRALNTALREGLRGLPGGDSLTSLRQQQDE